MSGKINVKEILKRNPAVDTQKLAEILKMMQELKAEGVSGGAEYNLVSPFAPHKPGHISQESGEEGQIHHSYKCR